jgi:hypothetical protein
MVRHLANTSPSLSHSLLSPSIHSIIKLSAMFVTWSLLTIPVVLWLATSVQVDFKPYFSTSADIRTECKTCPRSLCPNQLYYDFEENLNVTCWTRGTKIMGDSLWLKSTAGCYITQYDVAEYSGDCKTCQWRWYAFADVCR